jgi:hypothetical protein
LIPTDFSFKNRNEISYSSDKKKKESSKLSNKRQSLTGGTATPVVVKKQKLSNGESGSASSSPKKSITPGPSSTKKPITPMDKKDIKIESPKKTPLASVIKSETKKDAEGFTVPAPVLVPLHPLVQAKMDFLAQEAKKGNS